MDASLWSRCVERLESELNEQQLNTWIRPLQADLTEEGLRLLAPNRFVLDWVRDHFLGTIEQTLERVGGHHACPVRLEIGAIRKAAKKGNEPFAKGRSFSATKQPASPGEPAGAGINPDFVFSRFVVGKSNHFGHAAARQVADNPGTAYNPLLLYGGTGLGKTHLMHAVANALLEKGAAHKVAYMSAEHFLGHMVKALRRNSMDEFKRYYRSVNVLLIDDVQLFANKERTQEEFFHTFNALLDNQQQVILTCDRYPSEVDGLQDRLKSRFASGLAVEIEPPEFETRVAILQSKAREAGVNLPDEVAFFIAKRVRADVRKLEGALCRVIANSRFTAREIDLEFVKDALRDLLNQHDKLVNLDHIKKTVADYFKIRVADLLSKRRSRSITRPRQIAMALARELTDHSLPTIGDAFGGRDHTTVIHACHRVEELRASDARVMEDYENLLRILSG